MRFVFSLFFLAICALAEVNGSVASCNECCWGRLDVGPAYASIDILESGKTQRTLDLWAARGDATILVYQGLALKPWALWADGKANLSSVGIGIGYCIPLHMLDLSWYPCDLCITITPSVGYAQTRFLSSYHRDIEPFSMFLGSFRLKEKFTSNGGYGALEISWTFLEKWRLCAQYMYTWSYVRTRIKVRHDLVNIDTIHSKDHTAGPSYAISLERDITDCLTVNVGAAYNISLSKEKHGLRGKGVKVGLAYWF